MSEEFPFRFLGYDHGKYFYLPRRTEHVIELNAPAHFGNNLYNLAPRAWWEDRFAAKKKIDWDAAASFLIEKNQTLKPFNQSRSQRGVGVWRDGSRVVVHAGTHLVVDGVKTPIIDHSTSLLYERDDDDFFISDALDDESARKLVELTKMLSFSNGLSHLLLSGWIVIAPFCGILKWRPHIWITGGYRVGKSFVTDEILSASLGSMALRRGGGTTEASLRRRIRGAARPIIMDEMEAENKKDAETIQHILMLARKSSKGETVEIAGHGKYDTIEYKLYSCFSLSSINVSLKQNADLSRFTQIELKRFTGENRVEHFNEIKRRTYDLIDDDFPARMFTRTLQNMETLEENIRVFRQAAHSYFGDGRPADQLAPMLAGAYLLHSRNVLTPKEAEEWLRSHDWTDHVSLDEQEDHDRCFDYIMSSTIPANGDKGRIDMPIGKLASIALGIEEGFATQAAAKAALEAVDIKVKGGVVSIRRPSQHIERLLKETPWSISWSKLIAKCDGVELSKSPIRDGYSSSHRVIIDGHKFKTDNTSFTNEGNEALATADFGI